MAFDGAERRRYPRIKANFIVSYRVLEDSDVIDSSQTKNFSIGGMLFTTNKFFKKGTGLALRIRLPFDSRPVEIAGMVVDSREIVKNLIYDTRIEFSPDEKQDGAIKQAVDYYLKKKGKL
ncbi:MAG: PilZ domain-containing protein [Candidatus Omnitrophota bacterium]